MSGKKSLKYIVVSEISVWIKSQRRLIYTQFFHFEVE